MLESFRNPPSEYRVAPFWFWNFAIDEAEVERQIRQMHAKGVGGFFIHGRFGLRTEYMGEQWMRCIERACEIARDLSMQVYLYDENPFPSGVAGGEAMKDVKHFNKFLDIARQAVGPGETARMPVPEGRLLSAVAVDLDDRTSVIDLMGFVNDKTLVWTAPEGRYLVLVFIEAVARYQGFIYGSEPDYFEHSLLDTFFSFTHERYAQRLTPYLGTVIKGIFTDEPKIQCIYHMHPDGNTTAWFSDLLERFHADHGYDLKPNLACLATDCGPTTGKVRRDFWSTVTNQYAERFLSRYHNWCREHGIALTGHLFLEEGLYANTIYQGDFPRVLSEFDIPGVDHLGLSAESDYGIGNLPRSITRTHGQKLVSSVAHTHNRPRVLSETFGCCGWALSMEHMKWIADWQYSLGVNLLCPHAFYYSLAGVRKTDAPPSQFYQATYWPHYKLFADYVGRLSYALSQGKHGAQVALLYPIKGFQSEWAPGVEGPVDSLISKCFDIYCAYLLREHIDYDILTEEDLKRSAVCDQCLVLSGERYELLIMPPTTAVGLETALKIREFAQDGGKVLGTMLLPVEDADGDAHAAVESLFSGMFGQQPRALRQAALEGKMPHETLLTEHDGQVFFLRGPEPDCLIPALRDAVTRAITPLVAARCKGAECHDITCLRRVLDDGEIWFFSNNSPEAREVQLSIRCDRAPHVLDPESGQVFALHNCTQLGSRTVLLHRFERYGSLLLYFGDEPVFAVGRQTWAAEGTEIPLADDWEVKAEQPNCLTLDEWTLNILTQQDCMSYEYSTCFEADIVPNDLCLVLDDMPQVAAYAGCAGSSSRVFINDVEATEKLPWAFDPGFQTIPISTLARQGENRIRITISHGGWSGNPQLMVAEPRLTGSFRVDGGARRLLPPLDRMGSGSWTDHGYPCYSGTMAYSQTVKIPDFGKGDHVVLRADEPADMVEFVVNGASAGVRAWAPFEVEITHLVKPGPNGIELKITNSLANVLLSEPRASGLLGGARLIIY